jgi:hypothetical protein
MSKLFILISIIFGLILFGCKEEPSEVTELQVDEVVEQLAGFGWEANQFVQTGSEIEELTQESDLLSGTDIEIPGGNITMKQNAITLFAEMKTQLPKVNGLFKSLTDSLYIFINDTVFGHRIALYYNSQTGIARYYQVKYKFAVWRNLVYDSSEVIVDVNGTLEDGSDDMLVSLHQTQNFKDSFFVQSIIGDLIVTDFVENDITGAELTQDTYYHSNRYLSHLGRLVDFNPDNSGTMREDFDYKDGKTAFHSFTFNDNYTGSFAKQFRDGTQVSGTFDSVEDDLHGAWTELIQFPSGRYLDKIEREADVQILLPDSVFEASFFEAIYFSSGNIDSSSIDITVSEVNGIKTTVLDISKKNDAHGIFTIIETQDEANLTGNWTTWNGYYIEITDTQFYLDGSGHVHYEVWSSFQSNQNGDPAILVVDYYFSPDGEGNGKLSYDGKTYQITADESGQGTISQGGKSKQFNVIQ